MGEQESKNVKDVSDWLNQGHTPEELDRMAHETPPETTTVTDGAGDAGEQSQTSEKERSSASALVAQCLETDTLFHDDDGKAYAKVVVGNHNEIHGLQARVYRRLLAERFYKRYQRVASSQTLGDAITTLEGHAIHMQESQQVHVRTAARENDIYIDLADEEWQTVHVKPGRWTLESGGVVAFRRPTGSQPLPHPAHAGDVAVLGHFINVSADTLILITAWILAALRPRGPYPILALHGEHGSAKTTAARMIRSLIDPNRSPVRSAPRQDRDLLVSAVNCHVLALDNMSHIDADRSDALCRLSTGGGYSARMLYANDEEFIMDAQRPIIITGISVGEYATRADLIDRLIPVHLEPITEETRRPEDELWADFESKRAVIFAGLLDIIAEGLKNLPHVRLNKHPRMADFAKWIVACEPAVHWEPGTFLRVYRQTIEGANDLSLEASIIAQPLVDLLATRRNFEGSATALLHELGAQVSEDTKQSRQWPKHGRAMRAELDRIMPNLRAKGIDMRTVRTRTERTLVIEFKSKDDEQPSRPSRPSMPLEHAESSDGRTTVGADRDENRYVTVRDDRSPGAKRDAGDGCDDPVPSCLVPEPGDWYEEAF